MRKKRPESLNRWEESQAQAAADAAASIGGRAGDERLDPAQRPLVEAGEGVAEGFELAEEDLIEAAEHGELWADPSRNAFTPEAESSPEVCGEADQEASSEVTDADR